MRIFIDNSFEQKKPLLMKHMAAGGILNTQSSIHFLSSFDSEYQKLLIIFEDKVTLKIKRINEDISANKKWYKTIPATIFWVASTILVIIQIIESDTFKRILDFF